MSDYFDSLGAALAKLITAKLDGGNTEKAKEEFDKAQEDWAKRVSLQRRMRVTTGNGKVFENGQEIIGDK